jgi:hypothetical protein
MSYITRNHAMTASQSPRPACDDTHLPNTCIRYFAFSPCLVKGGCTISTYYPRPTTQTKIYQAQAQHRQSTLRNNEVEVDGNHLFPSMDGQQQTHKSIHQIILPHHIIFESESSLQTKAPSSSDN